MPFRAEKRHPDRQKILAEENRGRIEADSGEVSLKTQSHPGRFHKERIMSDTWKARKVVIVGAGAVGSTFAYALAQSGVGR